MKYEYWFANINGITGRRKSKIREGIKNIQTLYYIEETALQKMDLTEKERQAVLQSITTWELDAEYRKLQESGAEFITVFDSRYPKRLCKIQSPPYALYVKGKLPEDTAPTVAIVGARECSPYGEAMAVKFAESLAGAGFEIVSGMARGVDSAGQWGALRAGGTTYGVLGCGVDICYPRDSIELYMQLQMQGGILSEFSVGTKPLPRHFPARNRIISGLADVVLVIEAKEQSGSLITADMALEQGKDVYALPGPVNSHLSRGCNRLIHQGAGILLSPEELLKDLGIRTENENGKERQKKLLLETDENIVYSCLGLTPCSLEQILVETKFSVNHLLDILMKLQLRGIVREISKNYYAIVEET